MRFEIKRRTYGVFQKCLGAFSESFEEAPVTSFYRLPVPSIRRQMQHLLLQPAATLHAKNLPIYLVLLNLIQDLSENGTPDG